ncbi:MAG TPA: sigma 54-interacting transcriptional regulator, partial [Candidatus Krumholzibacterium sp.]|nr:sigma 54-interacting transcriptional regulator [Candidatus Krumholzibacterium sp.]
SLILQGNIRRKAGDYSGALNCYGKAGVIAAEKGFTRESVMVEEMKGAIAGARGNMTLATKLLTESLHTADDIAPSGDLSVDIRRRLGLVFLLRGEFEESRSYLESALSAAERSRDGWSRGLVLRALGSLYFRTGKNKGARRYFRKAIEVLRSGGCIHELARTHMIYASELLMSGGMDVERYDFGRTGPDCQESGEALRNLIEAGHLFSSTEDEILRLRADDMIEKLMNLRRRAGISRLENREPGDTVILESSKDILIGSRMAGVSEKMMDIGRKIGFAASFEKPVLITGETGTGKELVARMIHESGERSERPFIAVNCAAIPDHLFESEFFGHRKGCFTGATSDRRGFFEEADGGTVFLDEIGELSTLQQVKLLRVLQEKKIRRVGDNHEREADFRVICATNRDLEKMVAESRFREDLFFRINADTIHMPPLR